jgi:methionyl-tRNA formyltransferase
MDQSSNSIFIIASARSWNEKMLTHLKKNINGEFIFFAHHDDLAYQKIKDINPRYIFFPHWSWMIPEEIFNNFECIVFHMTDLPFGRGGSPLQNLIERGIYSTKISAIRVVGALDAGNVYLKKELSLHGNAEEIYLRTSSIVEEMIEEIVINEILPVPQVGDPVLFKRRKPEQSDVSKLNSLEKVFDYIRMLDAEGYPNAFIETEHLRFEFSRASLKVGSVEADVKIILK